MMHSKMGWGIGGALALLVTGVCSSAEAGPIVQPDNTPIPTGNGLQGVFDDLNDPVDAVLDAEVEPERFLPSCTASFTVHARFAAYKNSFGWYNVTGDVPNIADLHQILKCTDGPGVSKDVSILDDPDYAGGEIGFFQAVGNCADVNNPNTIFNVGNKKHIVYSEPEFNPDNNLPDPYIHLLIYPSFKNPRTYYFAWEDLLQGGDNDFSDLVTSVKGIDCVGWPKACAKIASTGDSDADLICEPNDNCPNDANEDQLDADMDDIGDVCDECPDDPDPDCVMVDPTTTGGMDTDTDTDTGSGTDSSTTDGTGGTDTGTTGDTGVTSDPTDGTGTTDSTGSGTMGTGDSAGSTGTETGGGTGDSNSGTGGTAASASGSDSGGSESNGTGATGSTGAATDTAGASGGADEDSGCGCTSGPERGAGIGSLFALLLVTVRRRRVS